MNGAMHHLTPTQIAAHERSKAFRARIDTLARKLKVALEAPVPKVGERTEPGPQPEPVTPKEPWFSIVKEVELTPRDYPSIAMIQKTVAGHFGLTKNDLQSACREWRIGRPRMIAIYLCRELTPRSFPEIGRKFGGRDHTTALHSHRTIQKRIETDQELAGSVAKLRELLA